MQTLADMIVDQAVATAKPEWLADILQRLIWLTHDNGGEICDTLRRWMDEANKRKIEVALAVTDGLRP